MVPISIEQQVKQQFARLFTARDAFLFKRMSDYYFKQAAFLKTADIKAGQDLKLLIRNCQKRLLIGIGMELLLKATYLKHGFSINKFERGQVGSPSFPFTFRQIAGFSQATDQTYMLSDLIEKIHLVLPAADIRLLSPGLRIAKVFRNKEGHVALPVHRYDPSNYRDVETTLVAIYSVSFGQTLEVHFSIGRNEEAVWKTR